VRYVAGASDMLTVIILEEEALTAERNLIELQNAAARRPHRPASGARR